MDPNIMIGKVQIIKVGPDQKDLLGKLGRVSMVTDEVNCIVMLDDGGIATVNINQLKNIR